MKRRLIERGRNQIARVLIAPAFLQRMRALLLVAFQCGLFSRRNVSHACHCDAGRFPLRYARMAPGRNATSWLRASAPRFTLGAFDFVPGRWRRVGRADGIGVGACV